MPIVFTKPSIPESTAYRDAVITDGATNYWRLDDATGSLTAVDMIAGKDLTYTSSPASVREQPGLIFNSGTAVDFVNNSYARGDTSASSLGTLTFPYTVELWAKIHATAPVATELFKTHDVSNLYMGLRVYMRSNLQGFGAMVGDGGIPDVTNRRSFNTQDPVTINANYYIVVVFNDYNDALIYINGVNVATVDSGSGSGVSYAQGFPSMHVDTPSNSSGADVTIDEVATYDSTALSLSTINTHYSLGLTG